MADKIGDSGLSQDKFELLMAQSRQALDNLRVAYDGKALPLLQLPASRQDLEDLVPYCRTLSYRF